MGILERNRPERDEIEAETPREGSSFDPAKVESRSRGKNTHRLVDEDGEDGRSSRASRADATPNDRGRCHSPFLLFVPSDPENANRE